MRLLSSLMRSTGPLPYHSVTFIGKRRAAQTASRPCQPPAPATMACKAGTSPEQSEFTEFIGQVNR